MSIISVSQETGLHVNTISKYFKAFREVGGGKMPPQHAEQLAIVTAIQGRPDGLSVAEFVAKEWGDATQPATATATQTATAAAIEENMAILQRKLDAILHKVEDDMSETNEMLLDFDARLSTAEDNAKLAIQIARATMDMVTRNKETSTEIVASAITTGLEKIIATLQPTTPTETEGNNENQNQ